MWCKGLSGAFATGWRCVSSEVRGGELADVRTPLNDCRASAELRDLAGGSVPAGLRDPRAGVFTAAQGQRASLGSNAKSSADDQLGVAAGLYVAGSSRLCGWVVRDGARPGLLLGFFAGSLAVISCWRFCGVSRGYGGRART